MADKEPPRLAQTKEGYAVFKHPILPDGKDCRTWYKVVGELPSKRPLLLLHGGPGGGHKSFMQCFDMYAEKTGTPVIYYDQLGCGNSTRLPEKKGDKLFWTPSLFVAELDNLVRHLGIRSGFDLLGQSWGAILAARYAISTEQKGSGLNKIIMSAGFARIRDAIQSVEDDIAAMPQQTQDIIHRCIAEGREDEYKYQLAFWEWCKKRMSTIIPRPKAGEIVFASFMPDDVVYSTMVGKDPFHMNQGNLRTSDLTEECKDILQPVLLLNGEFEELYLTQPFFDGIPKVKWFIFSNSSHRPMTDQAEKYGDVVWNFLKDQ